MVRDAPAGWMLTELNVARPADGREFVAACFLFGWPGFPESSFSTAFPEGAFCAEVGAATVLETVLETVRTEVDFGCETEDSGTGFDSGAGKVS